MKTVELFMYANCSSCRNAEALLAANGCEVRKRDLFNEPLTAPELRDLFARAGLAPREMLAKRSRPFRALFLAEREPGEEEILSLMAEHPALIRRPLMLSNGRTAVGFNRGAIEALARE